MPLIDNDACILTDNKYQTNLLLQIRQSLPPCFTRQYASKALGGLVSSKTLANLDSSNAGPPRKVKLGRRIGYERDSFIQWLESRLRDDL